MISVVCAVKGSSTAVEGSGIRIMSDSLIAFQPAIEEPSNITPSTKELSSVAEAMRAVCCHLPRGSVKRKSTNFTSFSLIIARTCLASIVPLSLLTLPPPGVFSYGGVAALASTNSYRVVDLRHEDLAVADAAGVGRGADRLDGLLDHLILDDQLDLHLGQEVDDVLGTAIELGMAFLPAESLGLQHGDALQPDLVERVFDLVEFEGLDDRFDLLHFLGPTPRASTGAAVPAARGRLREAPSMPDISTSV